MAITRKELPGKRWEIKATGKDIPQLKGMLNEHGAKEFQKSYIKGQKTGFERITDPRGNYTYVPGDKIEEYRKQGYGRIVTPSFVVQDLPWKQRHKRGAGRHRYKFVGGEFVEV